MVVENIAKVIKVLKKKRFESKKNDQQTVSVGFTQFYAIHVHENTTAHHPVGQAKFLEQPARSEAKEIARVISTAKKRGATMLQSLLLGGLRLQREAQERTPVDTGALKASAFTAPLAQESEAAEAAFQKSEEVRKQGGGSPV